MVFHIESKASICVPFVGWTLSQRTGVCQRWLLVDVKDPTLPCEEEMSYYRQPGQIIYFCHSQMSGLVSQFQKELVQRFIPPDQQQKVGIMDVVMTKKKKI